MPPLQPPSDATIPPPFTTPSPQPPREPSLKEGLWLAAWCGALYVMAHWVNVHLIRIQATYVGVALFFLPAGVKLIALVVARYWGAFGLFVANLILTLFDWPDLDLWQSVGMSLVWVGATLAVVVVLNHTMGLRADLKGLRFGQFVWLSVLAAWVHGAAFNGYLVFIDVRTPTDWLPATKAMALGDFLGSGVLLLVVVLVLKWVQHQQKAPPKRLR